LRVPEHQPLSSRAHQRLHGPVAFRFHPGIVAEVELGQVTMDVLLADMMVHPVDAPLQVRSCPDIASVTGGALSRAAKAVPFQ
jgi:hypothetical protein